MAAISRSRSRIPLCLADPNRRGAWPSGTIGLIAFDGEYTSSVLRWETPTFTRKDAVDRA
jgi:hypothetical protein